MIPLAFELAALAALADDGRAVALRSAVLVANRHPDGSIDLAPGAALGDGRVLVGLPALADAASIGVLRPVGDEAPAATLRRGGEGAILREGSVGTGLAVLRVAGTSSPVPVAAEGEPAFAFRADDDGHAFVGPPFRAGDVLYGADGALLGLAGRRARRVPVPADAEVASVALLDQQAAVDTCYAARLAGRWDLWAECVDPGPWDAGLPARWEAALARGWVEVTDALRARIGGARTFEHLRAPLWAEALLGADVRQDRTGPCGGSVAPDLDPEFLAGRAARWRWAAPIVDERTQGRPDAIVLPQIEAALHAPRYVPAADGRRFRGTGFAPDPRSARPTRDALAIDWHVVALAEDGATGWARLEGRLPDGRRWAFSQELHLADGRWRLDTWDATPDREHRPPKGWPPRYGVDWDVADALVGTAAGLMLTGAAPSAPGTGLLVLRTDFRRVPAEYGAGWLCVDLDADGHADRQIVYHRQGWWSVRDASAPERFDRLVAQGKIDEQGVLASFPDELLPVDAPRWAAGASALRILLPRGAGGG